MTKPLSHLVETGDWIFVAGDGTISKIIRKLTFSKVNHVTMVYDETRLFETDLQYGQALFHNLSILEGKRVIVIRPKFYIPNDNFRVRELCRKYEGTPYSIFDVVMNGLFLWLKDELRAKILGWLSNRHFMKCDELVARITWEVTHHKSIKDWEGYTPGKLLDIALSNRTDYKIIYSNL